MSFDSVFGENRGSKRKSNAALLLHASEGDGDREALLKELYIAIENEQYAHVWTELKAAIPANDTVHELLDKLVSEYLIGDLDLLSDVFLEIFDVTANSACTNRIYETYWKAAVERIEDMWRADTRARFTALKSIEDIPQQGIAVLNPQRRESQYAIDELVKMFSHLNREFLYELGYPAYIGRDNSEQWLEIITKLWDAYYQRERNKQQPQHGYLMRVNRSTYYGLARKAFRKVDEAADSPER
jgi:hypothetical protein